jgi:photosystem II stability/assembly factor-like uncharacterized protein
MKKIILALLACTALTTSHAQWTILNTGVSHNFNSIAFADSQTGVAVGGNASDGAAAIIRTSDNGTSWNTPTLNATGISTCNAVAFSTANNGWIACNGGRVLRSQDMGVTWDTATRFSSENLYTISFINSQIGFMAGDAGVMYRTNDGGTTWDTLNSGTVLAIRSLIFINASTGYYTGTGGVIATTSDAGDSWTIQAQPYLGFFNGRGIASTGAQTLQAVGQYGFGLNTANAGTTWNSFTTSTSNQLNAIVFSNSIAGVSCGNNGTILRTTDGGQNWINETSAITSNDLSGIAFSAPATAFICGEAGTILKSIIDISAVSFLPITTFQFSVFPNPATDHLFLQIELKQAEIITIQVTDLAGKIVAQRQTQLTTGNQIISLQYELLVLTEGLYFISVQTTTEQKTLAFVRN